MKKMLPSLIVFDLDACLWTPEMFELNTSPTVYDPKAGGMRAGQDTVRLFPGAQAVIRKILLSDEFKSVRVAVASSTTEPTYAKSCIEGLPCCPPADGREERLSDLIDFRQIYPGSKGRKHFPALHKESGVAFDAMLFFDDCTYGDNCADVASCCPGVTCVRTPQGLTTELFQTGLDAWASGKRGVVA
jgi:magnesium-dependent phosphatase 1